MSRWVVFDRATAEAVETNTGARADLQADNGERAAGVVAMAAAAPGMAVALMPSRDQQHVLVLRFTRPARPQAQAENDVGARVAPGGFLGLADEVVLEEDEPRPPKKWWQKILD